MDSRQPGSNAEHRSARDTHTGGRIRTVARRFADTVRRWPIPVAWAVVLTVMLGLGFVSRWSGSGTCDAPEELAGRLSASERPGETEAPSGPGGAARAPATDEGSELQSEPPGDAGTTPQQVLAERGDQAVVALGRSRGERRARMTFNPAVPEGDAAGVAESTGGETATGGESTPAANGEPATGSTDTSVPLAQLEGPEPIVVALNPLLREDGLQLGAGADGRVTVRAFAFSRLGVVTVELCVSRIGRAIHPGTYNGSVSIVDPRVQPTSAQFEVKAAYPNIFLVGALAWLSTGAASFYTWLLRERRRSDERLRIAGFSEWMLTRAGLLAVASGTIAGYVAFAATYLANPTWGVTPSQVTAIVGAVFSAFVTAATTILVSASE